MKKDDKEKTSYGEPQDEEAIPKRPTERRVVPDGKFEDIHLQKGDSPEGEGSPGKAPKFLKGDAFYLSRALVKWTQNELGQDSTFRQTVESGGIDKSRIQDGEVVAVEPRFFTEKALRYINTLEENLFLKEGRLDKLMRLSGTISECMLNYFDEIGDPDLARIEFVNMKREIGPMARNWRFVAEKREDEEGAPSNGRPYKYSIDFGDNGPGLALWAAPALANRLLNYGTEYRKISQSFRKALEALKAGERIERVFDPTVSEPSLILELGKMGQKGDGKFVGEQISQEMRLLEQNQRAMEARAKAFSDNQYMIVQKAFEAAIGRKRALKAMKDPKVKEALGPLEEYGENAFKYVVVTDKLSRLRDAISKEGGQMDFDTVMDKLSETVTGLRAELDNYRGIDTVLNWLYDTTEAYAMALGIGDGFSENLDDVFSRGGTYHEVIKLFGSRVVKILEEATKRCNATGSDDAEKLRDEMERMESKIISMQSELEESGSDNARLREDMAFIQGSLRREERFRNYLLSDNTDRYDTREKLDDMSRSLYAIFRSFDKDFRGELPTVDLKDPEYESKGDLVGSVKRLRRLLENMCTVFGAMEEQGIDSARHGKYMAERMGNVLGMEFESPKDMLSYVNDRLIPFYLRKEKEIELHDMANREFYGAIDDTPV